MTQYKMEDFQVGDVVIYDSQLERDTGIVDRLEECANGSFRVWCKWKSENYDHTSTSYCYNASHITEIRRKFNVSEAPIHDKLAELRQQRMQLSSKLQAMDEQLAQLSNLTVTLSLVEMESIVTWMNDRHDPVMNDLITKIKEHLK